MTQIAPLPYSNRGTSAVAASSDAQPESRAFRDALAQQSVNQLTAALDPSATASMPGAGVALANATAAPPADAASLASAELTRQDRQQSIRDRGLDAASASTQELRSRTASPAETTQPSQSSPQAESDRAAAPSTGSPATSPGDTGQRTNQNSPAPQQPASSADVSPHSQPAVNAIPARNAHDAQPAAGATAAVQPAPSAARTNAAIQAVNSMSAAQPATKLTSPAQPFSIDRTSARADGASRAKPAAAPAQQQDPTAQIQRGLAQVLRQSGGTLTMKLTPNELGEIKIALHVQQSRVTGTIDAQTTAARDLLTQNMDALKASLEQRGVTVDRLDVRLQGAAESDALARNGAEPRNEHASAHADAGSDRQSGFAGGGDRHTGNRDGAPGSPEQRAERGAAAHDRDDGHGRPDEPAGGWLRLDTTA